MAETFTGSVKLSVSGNLATTALDLGTTGYELRYTTPNYTLTNGTSANQANMIWTDTRTISASSSENIDLAGVLTNAFGTTITFTSIKGLLVCAASGNTNQVLVGGAASNAFINWVGDATDIIKVKPGGTLCLIDPSATGYAVTTSTGDILKIANSSSGTPVTYDIILIGTV